MTLISPACAAPLTFADALVLARAKAPSLQSQLLGIDATRAARRAAGALPDPKLFIGIDSFPISGPLAFQPSKDNFTMVRMGISQDIPNPAKRRSERTRADAEIAVAEAGAASEWRTVEAQAAVAWITVAFARKRLGALEAARAGLGQLVSATPSAVASGKARPAETLAGRQSLAALDDRRDELEAEYRRAQAELARWTGDAEPVVAGPIPQFSVDDASLRAAIDSSPFLAPAQAQLGQTIADIRLAEAARRPDFGVEAYYQHRDPRFGDYVSAGVTIGLPFFTRNRQNALIQSQRAEQLKAVSQREAKRRELLAGLEAALADHAMNHAALTRSRQTLEPLARERVELETSSYAAGRASLVDVVGARIALVETMLGTLDREALVEIDGARLTLTYGSVQR